MKILVALALTFSVSAFAQYTGMPGTGGRPDTNTTQPAPQPAPQPLPGKYPEPGKYPGPSKLPPAVGGYYPYPVGHYSSVAVIAFSQVTGAYGYAYGYDEYEVRHKALSYCGYNCHVVGLVHGGHIALATGRRNGYGWAVSSTSLDDAKAKALKNCGEWTRKCKIRAYLSSTY